MKGNAYLSNRVAKDRRTFLFVARAESAAASRMDSALLAVVSLVPCRIGRWKKIPHINHPVLRYVCVCR